MRAPHIRFMVVAVACGAFLTGGQGKAAPQTTGTSDPPVAVTMFADRIAEYVTTRARLEGPLPAFDERRDSWSQMLTRRYLASAIRAARPSVRKGTIFSPLVADYVHEVIARTLTPQERLALIAAGDDEGYVPLAVHEPVPAWAMQPVPTALCQALPSLPAGIEYRVVAPDLILWDAHAEIVIDVFSGAFLPPGALD